MEKKSKSNQKINNSFSPDIKVNFARLFLNKVDNNIISKLIKFSKEKKIKHYSKIEKTKISYTPRLKNMVKLLPRQLYFKNQRNIVPPIKLNDISEKRENNQYNFSQLIQPNISINYTQIKPNLRTKLAKYQNYSTLVQKVSVNNRNINLFSKNNNRKDIEVNKDNSFLNDDKFSKNVLNMSLKDIYYNHKPIVLPKINDVSKFFHNETLKNALKKPIKFKTKD